MLRKHVKIENRRVITGATKWAYLYAGYAKEVTVTLANMPDMTKVGRSWQAV